MRVVLISWSPDTAEAIERLRPLADEVEVETDAAALTSDPPDVAVIDLGQRPDEALALAEELRDVPRVFIAGEPGDVERVRAQQPDARFADWSGIGTILRTAIERPPDEPVAPA